MASTNVITDIESKNKATSHLYLSSAIYIIAYMTVVFIFRESVNILLRLPYYIFNFCCIVFMVLPSKYNKGRTNLESILVMLTKDIAVYRPYIQEVTNEE